MFLAARLARRCRPGLSLSCVVMRGGRYRSAHVFMQSNTGGKLIVLSASLPNVGPGALKSREDPKVFGTPKVRWFFTLRLVMLLITRPPGISVTTSRIAVLQDVCHRLFTSTGFCRYVLVQRFLSRCSNPWYAVSMPAQNVFLMNYSRLSSPLHGWSNLLLPCLTYSQVRRCY